MKIKFTFLIFIISIISALAQIKTEVIEKKDTSVKGQFDELFSKSGNYKEFKVIKVSSFLSLKKNILDSLKTVKSNLNNYQSNINTLKEEISNVKTSLDNTNKKLVLVNNEINSISFLGQEISKKTFKSITGGVFIGLLALLTFFILKFKNSNSLTKNALNSLNDVEKKFEEHRKRALEREQVVMRKLQDEINKQKQ